MKKKRLKILLGILFTVFFCWGCRAFADFLYPSGIKGRPDKVALRDEYYAVDSQTILADISKGRPIQLTLVPGEPEIQPSSPPVVPWVQDDYLRVANAIFLAVWGEQPENWKLNSIMTQTNCAGVDLGFQRVSFNFFKVERNENPKMYVHTQREIFIVPERNMVWIYELKSFPVQAWGWVGLEVNEIIPAEEALRIAEENGGRQGRSSVEKCRVSVDILAGSNHNNWQVWYSSDRNFFFMEVDEKTGRIVSTWSKPPAP